MEVLAPVLETSIATESTRASIPIPEAVSTGNENEKASLVAIPEVVSIEKQTKPAVVTEPLAQVKKWSFPFLF